MFNHYTPQHRSHIQLRQKSSFTQSARTPQSRLLRLKDSPNISRRHLMPQASPMTRSSSHQRSSLANRSLTPKNASFNKTFVQGIQTWQIRALYLARCEDLNIPVLPEQEQRFLILCKKNFDKRKFILNENNIGPKSAMVIAQILKSNRNFARVFLSKN